MHAELPALLSRKRFGHVHSLFDNGINVAMGDELIFIGTTKNGRLPFGIHMGLDHVRKLRQSVSLHDIVVASMPDLLLFRHPRYPIALDLSRAAAFQYELQKGNYRNYRDLVHLDLMLHLCRHWSIPNGLHADLIAEQSQGDGTGELSEATEHVERLLAASWYGNEEQIEKHVRYFLGRGQGLTPSGDDLLMGVLAVHTLTEAFHPLLFEVIHRILAAEEITTDVSKAYLQHALHGRFSDKVVTVLNAMIAGESSYFQAALIRLLQTGHSSGMDTAFGIANAVMALRRYKHVRTSCDCIGR